MALSTVFTTLDPVLNTRRCIAALAAAFLLRVGTSLANGPDLPTAAQSHPRGPDPTAGALVRAGPFESRTAELPSSHNFVGARVWYPAATSSGSFGVVAFAGSPRGDMDDLAERVASHGFVVLLVNFSKSVDGAKPQAGQLAEAFRALARECSPHECPALRQRVDLDRRALVGGSTGGGAALLAAARDPSLSAVVAMSASDVSRLLLTGITVPTLNTAYQLRPNVKTPHWVRGYHDAIPAETPKDYQLFGPARGPMEESLSCAVIVWLKRFVDNDVRYASIRCRFEDGWL